MAAQHPPTQAASTALAEAKRILPLPDLMRKIGDSDHAKVSAFCPFHENKNTEAFSVFQNDKGEWFWKCHAGCGYGDGVDYLKKRFGLSTRDAIARYCMEAGLNHAQQPTPRGRDQFDWPKCVDALTLEGKRELSQWRGLCSDFVDWLHREKIVGIYQGHIAFAVHKAGQVVGCHYLADRSKKLWRYHPKGNGTQPLTFGDVRAAAKVLCFESQWDAFGVMDKCGWHSKAPIGTAVFITRGSENGKLLRNKCAPPTAIYAFIQNDLAKPDGSIPAEIWLATVTANAGCKVFRVMTPGPHKDANDWTRAGATQSDIEAAIRAAKPVAMAEETSKPALQPGATDFNAVTAWIRGEILRSSQDKYEQPTVKNSAIACKVVEALNRIGRFYFHADLRDFDSAMFFDGHRKRLERIRSDAFSAWLAEWLCVNRATSLFKFVLSAVETAALSGPHTTGILPESYWAARPGALYLSNGDGAVVRITAGAVEEVDNGTDGVLFEAGRTLAPWRLTTPNGPFETCALFRNVHCGASHGKDLLRLWFYSFATMPRSKPPLGAIGEIGSGKTRTLKGIAELYGIPFRAAKVEEQLEPNFWPNVNEGGLFILDNADSKCRWLADAVAAAATDGCSPRRKLYTNSETVMLRANAWLAVTSANPTFGNDAGLADRLLVVRMERRGEETSDAALTNEILANRDAGLSHIAATLQTALADTGATPANLNSRHPDFASFAVRIGRALGREVEAIGALKTAEADKSAFCLENDAIGTVLVAFLHQTGSFTGTAAELAPKLIAIDKELDGHLSTKRLGRRLCALWPHLQKILTARRETDRNGVLQFTFKTESAGFAGFQTDFSQNP